MIVDILIGAFWVVVFGGGLVGVWALCRAAHNADEAIQREEARRHGE